MKITSQTETLIKELTQSMREQAAQSFDIAESVDQLRNGDYYGDSLPDSMADIAKSLRILSGREQLK